MLNIKEGTTMEEYDFSNESQRQQSPALQYQPEHPPVNLYAVVPQLSNRSGKRLYLMVSRLAGKAGLHKSILIVAHIQRIPYMEISQCWLQILAYLFLRRCSSINETVSSAWVTSVLYHYPEGKICSPLERLLLIKWLVYG
nr:hypothetical protein L203_00563 [Cryptococcus depauperatus CBS 7841]